MINFVCVLQQNITKSSRTYGLEMADPDPKMAEMYNFVQKEISNLKINTKSMPAFYCFLQSASKQTTVQMLSLSPTNNPFMFGSLISAIFRR